nr:ABC transporter ATP-binding protein [Rhodobacter sp. 24-YEA-8]
MQGAARAGRRKGGNVKDSGIILEARGLRKSFGGFIAIAGVDLAVQAGHIHALIGPNGAGKSTLFNLLTKFILPTAGEIRFRGQDITRALPAAIARMGMVRSFQISSVFPHLSVYENIRIALQAQEGDTWSFWRSEAGLHRFDDRVYELVCQVGLEQLVYTRAADLSYGRKRALELATTLALKPDLILLDEPMAGMGQEDIERTSALISSLAPRHTVLMVEHNLKVVADISDRITVLRRGEKIAEGDYDTVAANEEVRSAYMGGAHG